MFNNGGITMGFDPIEALRAAGKIADEGIIKVSKEVRDHFDEHAKRRETHLNNEVDRTLRAKQQKVDNAFRVIDTAVNALETVSDVYTKISQSINTSREIKLKIEESKNKFELEKEKLKKDFEELKHEYNLREKEENDSHEKEMTKLKFQEMARIETVKEIINKLLDLLYEITRETPYSSDIPIYIGQINTALSSLKSNQYCLEEQHS